jgi:hypothetical protein
MNEPSKQKKKHMISFSGEVWTRMYKKTGTGDIIKENLSETTKYVEAG